MGSNEDNLRRLIEEYRTGDCRALTKILNSIKGGLNLGNYYDPSQARDASDFEQIALTAVWKAIESFDAAKGSSATSWVITIVKQRLSREVRQINREHTDVFNHFGTGRYEEDLDDSENAVFNQAIDNNVFDGIQGEFDETSYFLFLSQIEARLECISIKLLKTFEIKIIWPDIDRQTLAVLLHVSRMSISKYFKTMRRVVEQVYEENGKDRIN